MLSVPSDGFCGKVTAARAAVALSSVNCALSRRKAVLCQAIGGRDGPWPFRV